MTWKKLLTYCLGEVGLRPAEFWDMTFAEIDAACQGYETRMAKIKEVPRVIAGILANVNRDAKSPPINIEDYIPLYTDKKKEVMTKDSYKDILKTFGREAPTVEQKEFLKTRYGKQ